MVEVRYTVQPSDEAEGLLGIARRLYGDASRWPELYDANHPIIGNNPSVIRAGQELSVPDCADASERPMAIRIYEVRPSDIPEGLPGIARRLYGTPRRWQQIHASNKGVIGDDPHYLQAGQRLIIL